MDSDTGLILFQPCCSLVIKSFEKTTLVRLRFFFFIHSLDRSTRPSIGTRCGNKFIVIATADGVETHLNRILFGDLSHKNVELTDTLITCFVNAIYLRSRWSSINNRYLNNKRYDWIMNNTELGWRRWRRRWWWWWGVAGSGEICCGSKFRVCMACRAYRQATGGRDVLLSCP